MNVTLIALLALVTMICTIAPRADAAAVTLNGGGSSTWSIDDSIRTSNGLPTGGSAIGAAAGTGFNVSEASLPAQGDAFDNALLLFLNNTQYGAPLTQSGQTVNGGSASISGLNVSMQYFVLTSDATLRTLATFSNPSGSPFSGTATIVTNVGSDGGTTVNGSSSGDLTFTTADRWVITDDGAAGVGGDPANTHVLFGPGNPAVTPSSVSMTVFSSAGTEGILANFPLNVPAGGTVKLLFFNDLDTTSANAIAGATVYNSNSTLGSERLQGLGNLAQIVNWDFGGTQAVPEPATLTMLATALAGFLGYRRCRRQ